MGLVADAGVVGVVGVVGVMGVVGVVGAGTVDQPAADFLRTLFCSNSRRISRASWSIAADSDILTRVPL